MEEDERGHTEAHAGVATGIGTAHDPTAITEYLSVIASSWLIGLGPHLRALVVPPYHWGHSHSIAAIALAVFAIESLAARLMLLKNWNGDSAVAFLYGGLPGFPSGLARSADELFLVRNSLAHNHIWRMRGTSTADGEFTAEGVKKLRGRDPHKKAPVRRDRKVTLPHRLNLVPELVGYADVRKAMAILVDVLDAMAAADLKNMPSAADTIRVELGTANVPTLRALGRMPLRPPRRPWQPRRRWQGSLGDRAEVLS